MTQTYPAPPADALTADALTPTSLASGAVPSRLPRPRAYLMCPPDHFAVQYAINPWMGSGEPVDTARAMLQWQLLRDTYRSLGHSVEIIDARPGLPDMVFAANGATVIGGTVLGARFRHPERAAEGPAYLDWFRTRGYRLVHPRFYHLDTALCVLDADTAAYYPAAFDAAGRAALATCFAELVEATDEDAAVLGLNAVSDGHHVVLPAQAMALAAQLAARGFEPVPVDMSEFRKAGGGPKCC